MRAVRAPLQILASLITLLLVPIGLAVADYADTRPSERKQDASQLEELVAQAKSVLEGLAKTRNQLADAAATARRSDDRLLATCLDAALDEVEQLNAKATSQWAVLADPSAASSARLSFVVITVIGQKANLVAQQATRCVGAEQRQPGLPEIAAPTDSNTRGAPSGDELDPTLRPQESGLPFAPPPPTAASTTISPSTGDQPMDMGVPRMPTAASPVL